MIITAETEKGEPMNCDNCRWYLYGLRPLTQEQLTYQRLAHKFEGRIVHFDTRMCTLGGCDGSKFERRTDDHI